MFYSLRQVVCGITLICGLAACASQQQGSRSSVVDYLYPTEQVAPVTPDIPVLTLPLRVGIAFVPADRQRRSGGNPWAFSEMGANTLSEPVKMQIMDNIASHFRQQQFIGDIQIIPSAYLQPQGSFNNLSQLKSMFGIDVIALISFDQMQFSDESARALSYWTLVGAYLVSGQKNDTSTMMDTAVYDIASRKLLFRAPGVSQVKGRSTPVNLQEELRHDSQQGFDEASKQMINNLQQELDNFTERLKQRSDDIKIVKGQNYRGGGSFNAFILIMLVTVLFVSRRAKE